MYAPVLRKIFNGAEIIFGGRLALTGHQMADVGQTLNYRRYHPRRLFSDLAARCQAERDRQELILNYLDVVLRP